MEKKTKLKIGAIISLLAGLLYVVVPTDIVPDVVPMAGWIDDLVAVLIAVANAIRLFAKLRKKNI